MGKIGILTYHTGYNYGASLQAYALQTTIERMGKKCEIINFETERFVASREMFSRRPSRPKELIKILMRLPYSSPLKERQRMFDSYTRNCLKLSPLYRTEEEVVSHASEYACIVCGSDQIWNLSHQDSPAANPLYFLNFPKNQKRISYAASFGKWVREAPQHEDVFLPWLKQFDAISVRETSGVEYVRSLGLDCTLCLDPTVLLDAQDYEPICAERVVDQQYVLLFSWSCTKEVLTAAKLVAKRLGLPLLNIVPPPRAAFKGIPRKLDVGPREFLSMVKNASFVVTNSFHGTAFSTTFEKPYISVVSGSPDTRMSSLLSQLGLEDHLTTADTMNLDAMFATDYGTVTGKKKALRKDSLAFLKNALDDI